jgi:tRNA-2-methylthio-N6-dimethylallyladenosine synthase
MARRSVYIETFGCQMNELDSELVSGRLRALGYGFTPDPDRADIVLYNTCSVREHAEQKVWSRLGEMKLRKAREPGLVVGVLGCMAERDGVDLIRRMPVVDILCGPGELDKLPSLLDNAVRTRESMLDASAGEDGPALTHPPTPIEPLNTADGDGGIRRAARRLVSANQVALQGNASRRSATLAAAQDTLEMLDLSRMISPIDAAPAEHDHAPQRSAYVRITRGCNKFCTYCVVPFTRGAEVHRPPEHILDECKRLADAGVLEVTLLGQTVNHYRFEHGAAITVGGVTQPQKGRSYAGGHRRDPFKTDGHGTTTTFADLLALIHEKVPAIERLRFVTSYPRDFGDDVLEVIRDHPRICRYLHVPAQSGSNRVLKAMNRGYEIEEYLEFLDRARAHLHQPEIGRPLMVSGDIIVGFPGETDEDFAATVALVQRARYKNCFIFKYSPRPGTIAFDKLPDDVPDDVKRRRNNDLLAIQAGISDEISRQQLGATLEVFVEGLSVKEQKKAARRPGLPHPAGHAHNGAVALTIGGAAASDHTHDHAGSACAIDAEESAVFEPTPAAPEGVQLSGRTDGDLIVFFDCPPGAQPRDFIGRIVPVKVDSVDRLSLHGELLA